MKNILTLSFLLFSFAAQAKTYYFAGNGNDNNNGSLSAPFQTLTKFNAVFNSVVPGDSILFRRGYAYYGFMKIIKAGTADKKIYIGAYGNGPNPVITGLTPYNIWKNVGTNLWESVYPTKSNALNMVIVKGVNVAMGRYPNAGYLTYTNPTLTSKTVTGLTGDWRGAKGVIRLHHWVTDVRKITAQSGTTITHVIDSTNYNQYKGIAGYGLFIQDHPKTLDQQNEWYWNPSSKRILIYSTTQPTGVQIPTIDTLVWLPQGKGNITFKNLDFVGSNKITIAINSAENVTIDGCKLDYAGQDGIWGGKNYGMTSNNFRLLNSTINRTNNNAVYLMGEFTNALLYNNTIKNTGLQAGMGKSGEGQMIAVKIQALGYKVQLNQIDSTGYIAVDVIGKNGIVSYNTINWFNMVKMDGGGIYTYGGGVDGSRWHHNTVRNSYPSLAGTSQTVGLAHGLYLDNGTKNLQVDSNDVSGMAYSCLYINTGSTGNKVFGNTFSNAGVRPIYNKESANTLTNNILK
jgi:hypothetical protein